MRFITIIVLWVCLATPVLSPFAFANDESTLEDIEYFFEPRYTYEYPEDFFEPGGPIVKFNPKLHLKIGIVVRNKSQMSMREIINVIFRVPPFDRYRYFFVFVSEDDVDKGMRQSDFYLRAYDSYGRVIPGGFDIGTSSVRAGLIVLNIDDYEFTKTGTKGYSYNNVAVAQKETVLHELGHALANLGEEYSIREKDDERYAMKDVLNQLGVSYEHGKHQVWNTERANIEYRSRKVLKWQPLIEQGFLTSERIPRVQIENGADVGRFLIPSGECVMNRIVDIDTQYCPVCQLQIIESICRLSGATPPWEE